MVQTNWDFDYPSANTELEIRYGSGNWTGFDVRQLMPHRLRPYCSIRMASSLRAAEGFLTVPLIDVFGTPNGWRDWKSKYAPSIINSVHQFNVDSYAIAASIAIEGTGACLLYDDLVKGSRLEPFLVAPLDATIECDAGYFLAYKSDKPLTGPATAFRAWLEAELGDA
jgi:LysR family glycine cleavage system transcriptional activator